MSFRVLHPGDVDWRASGVGPRTADLAGQLGTAALSARLWRIAPREALARHRHRAETELYVVLEGTGRIRVDDDLLTLAPLSALLVEPSSVRQIFNDTNGDALWLVAGSEREFSSSLELTAEQLAHIYPDGPKALPPELAG